MYGAAPSFRLTASDGRSVSDADLRGRAWAADFIFTRCQGICPLMNARAQELFKSIPDLRLVSFTADPEHDTPEALAAYARKWDAPGDGRWIFLTGEKAQLSDVSTGFHFNPVDEPMMHSGRFVLVDPRGRIRGYYDVTDESGLEDFRRDWRAVSGRP